MPTSYRVVAGYMLVVLWVMAQPFLTQQTNSNVSLVADIHPGKGSGADVSEIVAAGDVTYFVGNDPVHGPELWRTDGTPWSTHMIKEIAPGSVVRAGAAPRLLTPLGDLLLFVINANEQWVARLFSGVVAPKTVPFNYCRLNLRMTE